MIPPENRDEVLQKIEGELRKEGEELLDRTAAALPVDSGPISRVHEIGFPSHVILEQERILNPDLIVVGSHGRKGISRFLLGSVSHTLVHQARCPVLVVR